MKTMYKVTTFDIGIKKINVVKETEKQVVIKTEAGRERREAKNTTYTKIFVTYKEAKEFIVNNLRRRVEIKEKEITKLQHLLVEATETL